MKDLLKTGRVLGRSEMKKIKAGSGNCTDVCTGIGQSCFDEAAPRFRHMCFRVIHCCQAQCGGISC